jgi:hypothetical protein
LSFLPDAASIAPPFVPGKDAFAIMGMLYESADPT